MLGAMGVDVVIVDRTVLFSHVSDYSDCWLWTYRGAMDPCQYKYC